MRSLIRFLNWRKLRQLEAGGPEGQQARFMALVEQLRHSPVALCTQEANEQHYELPVEFFRRILGPAMKYSACQWEPGVASLAQAEQATLELYCRRALLEDGQDILDLGCGWGSFCLFAARRYPNSRILALSNSRTQREYIEGVARREGLTNLTVITRNIAEWEAPREAFDRVVSVEMLEHVRNYPRVFGLLHGALRPGGRLFVHVFCHERHAYPFDVGWLERHFFSGGLMPSRHLLLYFSQDFALEEHWSMDGRHYQKTSEAWLTNLVQARRELLPVLGQVYGPRQRWRWFVYWWLFFAACAELFGHSGGREWLVTHLRWRKPEVLSRPL